ncbi:aromatic amino acid ammonia-lyase [Amycolatopsis sp. YIM 10]|uniref:aromatic amino acid ammonia-lyase n=1 Tax=Amycolatopsis sp. YIM 10 TaxID=2653857 RepID=UPI0012A9631B|nr:aromatic amino acid ammonia-lyase [Amycolatopsis sp. YIM 10]QFU89731.1 Histidine ammonia-lyase [Amycolatopsis sp. YIM 10]
MTISAETGTDFSLTDIVRNAGWDARLEPCGEEDIARMQASAATVAKALAADQPVYGLTQGFGPLVLFEAESELEQGDSLISHLGSGQGEPLPPEACRLVVWLRLNSMRKGYSAVSPEFWLRLARLWNDGFTPAIPRHGTVSASGDLQPLAHAALSHTGVGEAWVPGPGGRRTVRPAKEALAALGAEPFTWPVREALAFVNGTGVGLAVSIVNQQSAVALVRAAALLTGRISTLFGANPEHFRPGIGIARGQAGQLTAARWIREELPAGAERSPDRPLQEPYSLRCGPQVLGAVLDQLDFAGELLCREANGSTDNPVTFDGEVLHGGNFHAMPVGFASDQIGLAVQMAAYLAERQLGVLVSPVTNGGLPPMLTPRPGRGAGLAGVQISATSFVSRIRQLVYPASLTTLPTNGWNQDHVPMALNGANSVADALDLAWLTIGSLAIGVAQLTSMLGAGTDGQGPWAKLAELSPPLDADRPMAAEVRAARDLLRTTAETQLATDPDRAF